MISAKTKLCCLIGDPVEHSLSPKMHNTAFENLGLDYVYLALRVKSEDLEKAILGIRALGIRGLNVTMPHKISVMRFLDKIDEAAQKIGAVNTIVNENGILIGFNTDGLSALRALKEADVEIENKKVIILGAGGAARSISFYITPLVRELIIAGKTEEEAKNLAEDLEKFFQKEIRSIENNSDNLKRELPNTQILINATPVGMVPNINDMPLDINLIDPNLIVFDVIYNPPKTKLLREAGKLGVKTINGIGMLVNQGAEAFRMWTGKEPPIELMKEVVINELRDAN